MARPPPARVTGRVAHDLHNPFRLCQAVRCRFGSVSPLACHSQCLSSVAATPPVTRLLWPLACTCWFFLVTVPDSERGKSGASIDTILDRSRVHVCWSPVLPLPFEQAHDLGTSTARLRFGIRGGLRGVPFVGGIHSVYPPGRLGPLLRWQHRPTTRESV